MPQIKFLLDTSCYLHLAIPFHPLLAVERGENKYTFYLTDKHDLEFAESQTIQTTPIFKWVFDEKYKANRIRRLKPSAQQMKEIDKFFTTIVTQLPLLGLEELSPRDIWYFAYAKILKTKLVTDDSRLRELADGYQVENYDTLELLHLMYSENIISLAEIRKAKDYWNKTNNFPLGNSFRRKYSRLFET